jgi:hypothetical protein
MKRIVILILAVASSTFAQETVNMVYQSGPALGWEGRKASSIPVKGSPYSATITIESIQTLADGNRITLTSTGTTARDSQGRTRQDAPLPAIGNLSAAKAPRLAFIQDPVAQVFYTLNLTDNTAQKISVPGAGTGNPAEAGGGNAFFVTTMGGGPVDAAVGGIEVSSAGPLPPPPAMAMHLPRELASDDVRESTEDLGSQMMEGVPANGVRTTRTIPAGQIGNEKPINIVTEVWTSPDLKTIVYSKRSDPRVGEQTFRLKNIQRTEPDASLFTVPADFKIVEGPQPIMYRSHQ